MGIATTDLEAALTLALASRVTARTIRMDRRGTIPRAGTTTTTVAPAAITTMAQGNTGSVVPVTKNGAPTLLFAVGIALLHLTTHVWDGTVEYGNSVEIESGNLVPPGNRIEVYHLERLRAHSVESIQRHGSTVELEVYHHEAGEYDVCDGRLTAQLRVVLRGYRSLPRPLIWGNSAPPIYVVSDV